MDYLLVKTTGRAGTFKKVLSNKTAYVDIPVFDDSRVYNDELKLQADQWFVLPEFKKKEYAPQIVQTIFNAAEWGQITRDEYDKIGYIVSVQSEGKLLLFQNVTSSQVYKRQNWLCLDEQPVLLEKDHLLIIHKYADAYYDVESDRLYFQRLSQITGIFSGINELYNEATDDEVEVALNLELLKVDPNFTKANVKTANRRRIREAMDMYNNYTEAQKKQIPTYIQKYCPGLVFDPATSKFEVNDEKTLTQLLNGLCQRYYTTEINYQKRVALSVETV